MAARFRLHRLVFHIGGLTDGTAENVELGLGDSGQSDVEGNKALFLSVPYGVAHVRR